MSDVKLYLGDCLDILPTLEGVDAVITDPPYGIEFQSNSAEQPRYEVLENDTKDFDLSKYWGDIERAVKPNGAIYVYCRFDIAHEWWQIVDPSSQIIIPRGRCSAGDLGNYSTEYEVALFKKIGKHRIDATELRIPNNSHAKNPPPFKRRIGNLWVDVISNEAWERAKHPTQKTVESIAKMIRVSTNPADTILDPFMGSGTTGVACVQLGHNFIGIEKEPKYFEIASKRIEQAQQQMVMPI